MTFKTYTATIVEQPKLSVKQLCEYAEANAHGRLSILKACKLKNPAVIAIARRYNDAEDLIATFLEYSAGLYSVLKDYAEDLRKMALKKTGKPKENLNACAEALDAFFKLSHHLPSVFEDRILRDTTTRKSFKFKLKSVTVSIRPELMISSDSGLSDSGFVKLYFGKTCPLSKSIGENMALLGKYYFREYHSLNFEREQCIVIDVFAGQIYFAPKAEKRAFKNLEACCEEIADRWEKISVD